MNYADILLEAAKLTKTRGEIYGDPRETYSRASAIASSMLGKHLSYYDIAVIMLAVKLARMPTDPAHLDNILDGINYLAFAGQFAQEPPEQAPEQPIQHNPMVETIADRPISPTTRIKAIAPIANPQASPLAQPYKFEKPQ